MVNVFLVIGSRNGKTSGRLDSSTLQRIVLFRHSPFCLEMSGASCYLPLFARLSAPRRLSCRFSIYSSTSRLIVRPSVRPFVRSFDHPSVQLCLSGRDRERGIRSYIRSLRAASPYYSFSGGLPSSRFLFSPASVHPDTNPDPWPPWRERHYGITLSRGRLSHGGLRFPRRDAEYR